MRGQVTTVTEDLPAAVAHDDAAEKAVLGIVIADPDSPAEARRLLQVDDFHKPAHQTIFAAVARMDDARQPVEPAAIVSELTRSGDLKRIPGGAGYIADLFGDAPPAASLGHYARIVKEASTRRSLHLVGMRMQQMSAIDGDASPAQIVEQMRHTLDELAVERLGSDLPLLSDVLNVTLEEIDRLATHGAVVGIPTGFKELDRTLNGLAPGQMITVAARPGVGKALALDTPLPTPSGWTTMGNVRIGDEVIGRDGHPTRVLAATHPMQDRPCYNVVFSDGSTIVADAQHLWVTETADEPCEHVRTTEQIAATLTTTSGAPRHAIRTTEPLRPHGQAQAPIAPYTLGVWLAAGTPGQAQITCQDTTTLERIRQEGYTLIARTTTATYAIDLTAFPPGGFTQVCPECLLPFYPTSDAATSYCSHYCTTRAARAQAIPTDTAPVLMLLKEHRGTEEGPPSHRRPGDDFLMLLGNLGIRDHKHVPDSYLRAPAEQRRLLLEGLLAGQGHSDDDGTRTFTTESLSLARNVEDLANGLGHIATFAAADALTDTPAYLVRIRATPDTGRAYRFIVSVTPAESVPVRCIQVDNDDEIYLAGLAMIPTHNSSLALDIARHAALRQDKAVMVFSLEMSAPEVVMRMLSAESYVDMQSMRSGDMDEHKWQQLAKASARMFGAKLAIDENPSVTLSEIRAKARAFQRTHGLDLIVIDYLQLMNADRRSDSRQQEVSDMSRSVKLLAKEFKIPVIILSQLNRGSEQRSDKRPLVSDLRESGAIEQDSDVVILIHREEIYEPESPKAGTAEIIIGKNRAGATPTITLAWLAKMSTFQNLAID